MGKLERYKLAMRASMVSAERDYRNSLEDRRGFVIGGVLKFWGMYQRQEISENEFDELILVLSGFNKGEHRHFVKQLAQSYKGGNPPTIIGY